MSCPLDFNSEAVTIFLLYRYVRSDYEERNFSRRVLAYVHVHVHVRVVQNTFAHAQTESNIVPASQDEFDVRQVTRRAVDVWQLLDSIWRTNLYSFGYVFI